MATKIRRIPETATRCGGPKQLPERQTGVHRSFWRRKYPITVCYVNLSSAPAGWGILFNVAVCWIVSAQTQSDTSMAHRMRYHNFLREHATLSADKRALLPVAWGITLAWLFFGIGPGAVIGNWIFGEPGAGVAGWTFGMPSIWAWQILFWALASPGSLFWSGSALGPNGLSGARSTLRITVWTAMSKG